MSCSLQVSPSSSAWNCTSDDNLRAIGVCSQRLLASGFRWRFSSHSTGRGWTEELLCGSRKLTCRGDIAGALQTILTDPPYGEGVDQAKVSRAMGTQLQSSDCGVIEPAPDNAPRARPISVR